MVSSTQSIQIGQTTISYKVRFSDVAKRKSIHVTPHGVEVVAPDFEDMDMVRTFVKTKRRWLFDAVREVDEHTRLAESGPRYETGSKIMYRGRRLRLHVIKDSVPNAVVNYRTRFDVTLPDTLPESSRPAAVKVALDAWMKERCRTDAVRMARRFAATLGLEEPTLRMSEQEHMWGTCGKDDIIRINWRLAQAPVVALEYVVAHEVCHILDRSHGDSFWALLSRVHSTWQTGKKELERWERI